jgi:hypothetical protein
MNKEYLFEKQGNDGEIERLEQVLAAYRFEPGEPPGLPSTEITFSRRRFGWLKTAFVAGAAAMAVIVGLLTYDRTDKLLRASVDSPAISTTSVAAATDITPPIVVPPSPDSSFGAAPADNRRQRRMIVSASYRRMRESLVRPVRQTQSARLTKKEQYAYDQLLVALWITGTKLKVVQDTIDRTDEKTNDTANQK